VRPESRLAGSNGSGTITWKWPRNPRALGSDALRAVPPAATNSPATPRTTAVSLAVTAILAAASPHVSDDLLNHRADNLPSGGRVSTSVRWGQSSRPKLVSDVCTAIGEKSVTASNCLRSEVSPLSAGQAIASGSTHPSRFGHLAGHALFPFMLMRGSTVAFTIDRNTSGPMS
jgi:hypothetical protein